MHCVERHYCSKTFYGLWSVESHTSALLRISGKFFFVLKPTFSPNVAKILRNSQIKRRFFHFETSLYFDINKKSIFSPKSRCFQYFVKDHQIWRNVAIFAISFTTPTVLHILHHHIQLLYPSKCTYQLWLQNDSQIKFSWTCDIEHWSSHNRKWQDTKFS